MAEPKTRETAASVAAFLGKIKNEVTRRDCDELVKLMQQATRAEPKMWGPSIIGFGSQPLKYASGRELDWPVVGFSPRKVNLSLYLTCDLEPFTSLLKRLGKHSKGKGCLYIKKLKDVDKKVLKELIRQAVRAAKSSEA